LDIGQAVIRIGRDEVTDSPVAHRLKSVRAVKIVGFVFIPVTRTLKYLGCADLVADGQEMLPGFGLSAASAVSR
jgi:hypothetical protein